MAYKEIYYPFLTDKWLKVKNESWLRNSILKFVLVVMLDEPKANKQFIYEYRDGRPSYKGNWRNTAGWTTVWITGQIIEKIGPILATKY